MTSSIMSGAMQYPRDSGVTVAGERYYLESADGVNHEEEVLSVWRSQGLLDEAEENSGLYRWFYRDNPQGTAEGNILVDAATGEGIGFLGVGSRAIVLDGNPINAGVLVDFVVDRRHRTLLPALQLQRLGQSRALKSKKLLFGIPNANARGVCRRVGFDACFEVLEYCRVLRHQRYAARHMPVWLAKLVSSGVDWLLALAIRLQLLFSRSSAFWTNIVDSKFDEMWHAFDKRDICIGVRDAAFLKWRFGQHPNKRYRYFQVRSPEGHLYAWFVCERVDSEILIKDCLALGGEVELRNALLELCRAAYDEGAEAVRLHMSPVRHCARALRRARFSLRKSRPCFVTARQEVREQAGSLPWYITQADEDI